MSGGKTERVRFKLEENYRAEVVANVLRDRGWRQVEGDSDNWNLYWCGIPHLRSILSKRLLPNQKVPHFSNHYELTRKNHLARNLQRLKKKYIKEGKLEESALCDCIPVTFELPGEYLMFVEYFRQLSGAIWIVKPSSGSQGRGIFLFKKLKDLNEWKSNKDWSGKEVTNDKDETEVLPEIWVVQKYIENPYLLADRKFDLRVYVLVTSYSPLKFWVSRDGFARFSGSQFDIKDVKDNHIHLTNCSIQLSSACREKQGHKWKLRQLREFLTARHGFMRVEQLVQDIAQVVLVSLTSVAHSIVQSKHCFEMYGYDILLTEDLRPWLLEVNASPSLHPSDNEDYNMKYGLLMDALTITDLEGRLKGDEIRVGGWDLLWNDGPVPVSCVGSSKLGPTPDPTHPRLNIFLGALNDREQYNAKLKSWLKLMDTQRSP